jgi:hypothetical protein
VSNTGNDPKEQSSRSGISLQTLTIASLASAAASYAVAHIWGPGTLLGAAAAPVIIALVSESLRRPMHAVAATASKAPSVASAPAPGGTWRELWRPRWRIVLLTGLAAFAIVVGVFTVPDLLAGSSITGNGQPTTFFSGVSKVKRKASVSTTTTTTPTHATVTKTATARTTTTTSTAATSPTTSTTTTQASTPGATTTSAAATQTTTSTDPTVISSTTPSTPVP